MTDFCDSFSKHDKNKEKKNLYKFQDVKILLEKLLPFSFLVFHQNLHHISSLDFFFHFSFLGMFCVFLESVSQTDLFDSYC